MGILTVPSSIYTAVPHRATVAPSSHMTSDRPTLPDERKITLGVANILHKSHQPSDFHGERQSTAPSAYDAVEYERRGAQESCE
ncbi:hypothetical protein TRAPUB_6689 [Trametes pubescens]|uniref:Uncharacterized protein n=1 Tax=Trametes pubescens TaxID=154538 RepID=A0A1M2V5I5_TRAPU|nr:hypothetical protein TRAPUB_6689 [Trametes pubescens]